jgi:hypothetical protein
VPGTMLAIGLPFSAPPSSISLDQFLQAVSKLLPRVSSTSYVLNERILAPVCAIAGIRVPKLSVITLPLVKDNNTTGPGYCRG